MKNFLHSFRIAHVKPILAWRNHDEVIANLQVSPTLVVEDPGTDTKSR